MIALVVPGLSLSLAAVAVAETPRAGRRLAVENLRGRLARLVAFGAQNAVVHGIENGLSTAGELSEYLPLLLESSLLAIFSDIVHAMKNVDATVG
jgi:hypothetical protein